MICRPAAVHVVTLHRFHEYVAPCARAGESVRRSPRNLIHCTRLNSGSSAQQVSFPLFTFLRESVKVSKALWRNYMRCVICRYFANGCMSCPVLVDLKCVLLSLTDIRKTFLCEIYCMRFRIYRWECLNNDIVSMRHFCCGLTAAVSTNYALNNFEWSNC